MKMSIKPNWEPGHFYSPDLSIEDVEQSSLRKSKEEWLKDLPGICLHEEEQLLLAERLSEIYENSVVKFPEHKNKEYRYNFINDSYSYSDAITLSAMIQHLCPSRLIEIGSGYSSGVILDTLDRTNFKCECIFIEPYPNKLYELIQTKTTNVSYEIIPKKLQDIPLTLFKQLKSNDILFIDSTHVSKAGSDVNYLIHNIFPVLAAGVYIHIHDVFWPFEYPLTWLNSGIAWNEQYMIRAFLQYNNTFQIKYFITYLWHHHPEKMKQIFPLGIKNIGGNLWLEKTYN